MPIDVGLMRHSWSIVLVVWLKAAKLEWATRRQLPEENVEETLPALPAPESIATDGIVAAGRGNGVRKYL